MQAMTELLPNDFIERDSDSNIESAYVELKRTKDYSNTELYPTEMLEARYRYWINEMFSPVRSERNKQEIKRLTTIMLFEAAARSGTLRNLEELYNLEDAN